MNLMRRQLYIMICWLMAVATAFGAEERRTFRVINAANGLADNSADVVICTKTGRMIISTIGNINFYDGTSFSHINDEPVKQIPLQHYHGGYRTASITCG